MARKFIILICICFTACCAVIAYLSMQVEKEVQQLVNGGQEITCESLLEEQPKVTTRIKLTEFTSGKFKANFDFDGDGQWDDLCVPLFPAQKRKITYGYPAILLKIKGVTNQEQLDELMADGELETNYWPQRQELDEAIHSSLAQSYTNMDFANSFMLHCGYESKNPVLGETSLKLSIIAGGISLVIALLTFLAGFFIKPAPQNLSEIEIDAPVSNRAGLPTG